MKRKTIVVPEKKLVVHVIECYGKSFVGKAKCNDDDVFDEDFGKKLSKLRANKKLSSFKRKRSWKECKAVQELYNECMSEYTKETYIFDKIEYEIQLMLS